MFLNCQTQENQVIKTPIDQDFIHLAREDQVPHVVQKFWNEQDHVILQLVTKQLKGCLTFETNPGGTTQYYHLYEGSIPLEAVANVTFVTKISH